MLQKYLWCIDIFLDDESRSDLRVVKKFYSDVVQLGCILGLVGFHFGSICGLFKDCLGSVRDLLGVGLESVWDKFKDGL